MAFKNIAQATNDAKLSEGQDFEKVLVIERNADGTLAVSKLRKLGDQGGSISDLLNANTVAVVHNHPYYANKTGEYNIQTPTPVTDTSALKFRNIPSYVFSDKTNTLYEVYREDGKYKYAAVKNDLSLGKGIVF